jgi:uncharacterized tellurite resistance protein B-like protein/RNA polymerase subunit RPABC4/transcription elongation factor Spt4
MAKVCKKCNASVNNKSMECPYCGSANFEVEIIEPVINIVQPTSPNIQQNPSNDNNNEIYSNKLEQLIDLALSDGELTEKEKQVLFKKAEAEGIDLDEFEMVLDSKIKNLIRANKFSLNESNNNLNENREIILDPNRYAEIEKLIEIAITDGHLSENERNVIIAKGFTHGIPKDELAMIIDSKVAEKQKLMLQTAAPKSDKFGDIKKCPACGSIVTSFSAKCSDCGHEFSNIGANASIGKLFEMLNACENDRKEQSTSVFGAMGSLMAQGLAGDKVTEKKKSIISGFPIPNTKDDILEFLSTAIPNAKQKGTFWNQKPEYKSHNDLAPTWLSKCEQIVIKAKFSLKDDKKTLEEIMTYAKELGIK